MNYVRFMNSIWTELHAYKSTVDQLCNRCHYGNQQLEKEVKKLEKEGIYTPAFIARYKETGNMAFKLRDEMSRERAKTMGKVVFALDQISDEMNQFFRGPVDPEFSAKITAINAIGLPLTDADFETMEEEAKSYMEHRLLRHLAETRKKEVVKNVDGKAEKSFVSDAYVMKNVLPDLKESMQSFEEFKSKVLYLVSDYCGIDAVLFKALENYQNKADFMAINADAAVRSSEVFKKMDSVLSAINKVSPKWSRELPTITKSEKEYLDANLDPSKAAIRTRAEMQKFAKDHQYLGSLVQKDERYMQHFAPEPQYIQ